MIMNMTFDVTMMKLFIHLKKLKLKEKDQLGPPVNDVLLIIPDKCHFCYAHYLGLKKVH